MDTNIGNQKTKLTWDNYMDYLIEAIDESNFMKRSEYKPMMTAKHDLEAHVSSRASHVRSAANIAKRIAKSLGLNHRYIYASMLMHDAGHPFSAHDGEEIFQGIAELYNTEYFHHNAKGVEVVISENVCGKAISKIPNISERPELRKKLEEEFDYFLDVIISHDGEAGVNDMKSDPVSYPDMKTAVATKLQLSNSTNNYKFIAQTIEGRIAKYADVIAYLSSDIQDRFRLGIQKNFGDDYLEFIGEILAKDFARTTEEKKEIANNIINKIKEDKLRELLKDAREIENREIINSADQIIKEIHNKKINYETQTEETEKIIEEHIEKYIKEHSNENMTTKDKKILNSDIQKIREFAGKKLRMRSSVITEIMGRIQEVLINDLLKESKAKGELGFSKDMNKLFFTAKGLNYTYVPDTKWEYQRYDQPVAIYKLVHMVAQGLRHSGAIANKFYDRAMRKYVKDEEALRYLETLDYVEDSEYAEYKKKHNIRDVKSHNSKYTSEGFRDKVQARNELLSSSYDYVQNEGETFAIKYENTFKAVENQVMTKIRNSLGRLPESETKKRITHIEFFDKKILGEEQILRKAIIKKYGNPEQITDEQIAEFAKPIIERERRKMEGKMAVQLAIDYISGMTDRGINMQAIQIGVLDSEKVNKSRRGSSKEEKEVFSQRYDTRVSNTDSTSKERDEK